MPRSDSTRGQIPIDFLTGMAVFFAVVGFVVLFVPGLLTATEGGQEKPMVADRVGTQLVEFHLGEPGSTALDTDCTLWFFNQSSPDPCDTFDTSAPLSEQVGINDGYDLNVTLRRNVTGGPDREVLCADGDEVVACSTGGTPLAVGPPAQTGEGSVATAKRHVTIDGTDATLLVEVW